jgi:polyhydroxybutyrate depolymerase
VGGERPTPVYVPSGYVAGSQLPLVILLHGYSVSGTIQESYFALKAQAELRGFFYAHPDGTIDSANKRFWNATDACCNFDASTVDDDAYLMGLVEEISSRWTIDPKRIYFVGHSNGGFMSHRLACNHADKIAAIVSLAGAQYKDVSKCTPSEPVSVLQIHGDADETISYTGGDIMVGGVPVAYPSATETVQDWATLNGCSLTADTSGAPLDLITNTAGTETTIASYGAGCQAGGHAELWTASGGPHAPGLTAAFRPAIIDFLFSHPKP